MTAVLLDLYDTLVWTEWPMMRERLARAIGVTTRDIMRGFIATRDARGVGAFGNPEGDLAAALRAAGGDPTPEQIRELTELELKALLEDGIHVYDDVLPVLRELRRRDVTTAIVSNCDHWTRPVVELLGLERQVQAVVLSFEVGVLKPDPAIYRIALERMRAAPDETTFVDDQPAYLDAAAALGIRTLRIVRPPDNAPPEADAHPVIEDLTAVLARAEA